METETLIYQVVDQSDEEVYYTLGFFLTKEEALSVLDSVEPPSNDCDLDCVMIKVKSHPVGFKPHACLTVASRTWERDYGDNGDEEPRWIAHPTEWPNK